MSVPPPSPAVAAVLAEVHPGQADLVQRWAAALASAGGLYGSLEASALAAVARGSIAALQATLARGETELPIEAARRFVDPPQYRNQPLDEFILAGLRIEQAMREFVAERAPDPTVAVDAGARLSAVLASSILQVVRLREQRLSAGQLLTDVGRLLGSAAPGAGLERVAARIVAELGGGACVLVGASGGQLERLAASSLRGPATPTHRLSTLDAPWPATVALDTAPELAPIEEGQHVSLALSAGGGDWMRALVSAGFGLLEARPLLLGGETVGAALVLSPAAAPPTPRALAHLESLAPLLAAHVALARSTGALVQADAAITALLETSPTMMCTLDRHGRILRTNSIFRARIGVPDDVIGMPLSWLLHPGWSDRFPEQWALIQASPDAAAGARLDLITADTTRLPLALDARWLEDEVAPPRTCLLALWDIGQYVDRAEKDAHQIDALDAFVRQVAHDLRAPLRSIAGFASLLADEVTPPAVGAAAAPLSEAQQYAERIEAGVVRMDALISGLLRYARSTALDPGRDEIPPAALLRDATDRIEGEVEARQVAVTLTADDTTFLGDHTALSTLVTNLLDNALRHSAVGGHVEVAVHAVDAGWAELAVRDFGPGVDPEDRERIFKLFEKGGGPLAQSGIGLAVVRRIAKAHGGRVWVESPEGGGARFVVRLPTT